MLTGVCLELSMGWDWEKAPIPLLPHDSHTPAQQGSSWAYLFRSVHAVPGFVFQEILFSKVTFATLGTFKWLLSSVFPWGMQIQNPITACQQHLHRQAQEVTGKGEVGTSPTSTVLLFTVTLKLLFCHFCVPSTAQLSVPAALHTTPFLQGQDSSPTQVKQSLSSHCRAIPCSQ